MSGITSFPELHCGQKYVVCRITHTQCAVTASASYDVFGYTVEGAVGH